MKKLLAIMLLVLYGLSSTGMTLHLHYCCGKLDKVDLTPPKTMHCNMNKGRKLTGQSCCDTKQINLKLKGDQAHSKVVLSSFQLVAIQPAPLSFFVFHSYEAKKLLPEIFAPPPIAKDVNHLYCTYRI